MFTGMEWLLCPNLALAAATMRPVIQVESGGNPYAIGVVGARLERQPRNLAEAVATARSLGAAHRGYAVGLAQVSRANLRAAGITTFEDAFSPCANVAAGARLLADCHARASGHWGRAFSCYYSGDFTTGYRDGYVQKIYAAMAQDTRSPATQRPDGEAASGMRAAPRSTQAADGAHPSPIVLRRSTGVVAGDGVATAAAAPDGGGRDTAARPAPGPRAPGPPASRDAAFVF